MIFKKIFVTTIFFREIALPFFDCRTEPSVMLTMINNQPHSGVFQTTCPILGKTKGLFIFLFIKNFHLT